MVGAGQDLTEEVSTNVQQTLHIVPIYFIIPVKKLSFRKGENKFHNIASMGY